LELKLESIDSIKLQVIATTGWTTTNLISAIKTITPPEDHDLVTLLIGVNNQYQGRPFSIYQAEFPQLVNTAIQKAKGDKSNIIVLNGIRYVNITDITREGLTNPELVASDGLHPSELAYSKFVDSLLPIATVKLEN